MPAELDDDDKHQHKDDNPGCSYYSLKEVMHKIVMSYDWDNDGILNWNELLCFMLSFFRTNCGYTSVGFWRSFCRAGEKYDVTQVPCSSEHHVACQMSVLGAIQYTLDQYHDDNKKNYHHRMEPRAAVKRGLLDHGYEPVNTVEQSNNSDDKGCGEKVQGVDSKNTQLWKRVVVDGASNQNHPQFPPQPPSWSWVYQRSALDKKIHYSSWNMDVTNTLNHVHAIPTNECLDAIEAAGGDPQRGMWQEREDALQITTIQNHLEQNISKEMRQELLSKALANLFDRCKLSSFRQQQNTPTSDPNPSVVLNELEIFTLFVTRLSGCYSEPLQDARSLFGKDPSISKQEFVDISRDDKKLKAILQKLLIPHDTWNNVLDTTTNLESSMDALTNQMPILTLSELLTNWARTCLSTKNNEAKCLYAFRGAAAILSRVLAVANHNNGSVIPNRFCLSWDDLENLQVITRLDGLVRYCQLRDEIANDPERFTNEATSDDESRAYQAVSLLVKIHMGMNKHVERNLPQAAASTRTKKPVVLFGRKKHSCKTTATTTSLAATDDYNHTRFVGLIDQVALHHANAIVTRLTLDLQDYFDTLEPSRWLQTIRGQIRGGLKPSAGIYIANLDRLIPKTLEQATAMSKLTLFAQAAKVSQKAGYRHVGDDGNFTNCITTTLHQLAQQRGTSFVETIDSIVASKEGCVGGLAPEAWLMIKAKSTKSLPTIVLPSNDDEILNGGPTLVHETLCKHFGIARENETQDEQRRRLNDWFYRNGHLGKDEDLVHVILQDLQTLANLGLTRLQIADAMEEALRGNSKAAVAAYSCPTMGHHQDVFYPSDSMHSYYLGVGGSADCVLINYEVSENGDGRAAEFLEQERASNKFSSSWDVLLSKRLNARSRAAWQDWDGVLYISDMQPYLTRHGLFQGLQSRYRVDPERAAQMLGLIS